MNNLISDNPRKFAVTNNLNHFPRAVMINTVVVVFLSFFYRFSFFIVSVLDLHIMKRELRKKISSSRM